MPIALNLNAIPALPKVAGGKITGGFQVAYVKLSPDARCGIPRRVPMVQPPNSYAVSMGARDASSYIPLNQQELDEVLTARRAGMTIIAYGSVKNGAPDCRGNCAITPKTYPVFNDVLDAMIAANQTTIAQHNAQFARLHPPQGGGGLGGLLKAAVTFGAIVSGVGALAGLSAAATSAAAAGASLSASGAASAAMAGSSAMWGVSATGATGLAAAGQAGAAAVGSGVTTAAVATKAATSVATNTAQKVASAQSVSSVAAVGNPVAQVATVSAAQPVTVAAVGAATPAATTAASAGIFSGTSGALATVGAGVKAVGTVAGTVVSVKQAEAVLKSAPMPARYVPPPPSVDNAPKPSGSVLPLLAMGAAALFFI